MEVLDVHKFMDMAGNNIRIVNAIAKTHTMLERYTNPVCSVSGGSDSDVMLDMVYKLDTDKKVKYIWFNTGLEYQATKDHKSIPVCCKEYGQPFLSKITSYFINCLQKWGFDFKDEPYEEQIEKYPKIISRIKWWHGKNIIHQFNCSRKLHRFLVANPPNFNISPQCCDYAKKMPVKLYQKEHNIDMQMFGVRKSEGGIRSILKNCVTQRDDLVNFRPIFGLLTMINKNTIGFSVLLTQLRTHNTE